ncbi:MAG: potassium-transporting ATPase subunit KdpC [Alphaproteobacteria bacterium]
MLKELRTSFMLFLILMLLTGFGYPLLVLSTGQTFFPDQANGSLIKQGDTIVGSTLIGQSFTADRYFHPRPSAAGNGYDAAQSSGSNLGPTNPRLIQAVKDRIATLRESGNTAPVPIDLVTASASGLDPDISIAAARFQIQRIAEVRRIEAVRIDELINRTAQPRTLGFLGENRVNVLRLNQALDQLSPNE